MSKLINCKLCKSEMSSNATKCPKCGEKNNQRTSPVAWALLLVILYCLYLFIKSAAGTPTYNETYNRTSTQTTYKAQDFINAAHSSKEVQGTIFNSMTKEEQDKASKILMEERKDLIPYFFDKSYVPKDKTLYINNNRN